MKKMKGRGMILILTAALLIATEHLSASVMAKQQVIWGAEEGNDFIDDENESTPVNSEDSHTEDDALTADLDVSDELETTTESKHQESEDLEFEEIEKDNEIPSEEIKQDEVMNSVCVAIDSESFLSCVSDGNELNLKLENDIDIKASQLPMIDADVLTIDLNGHVLTINICETEPFNPIHCSLFQLISDAEHAGGFFINSNSSELQPLIEISSYGFLVGANSGIQFYSKGEAYTIINLSAEATMNIQTASLMSRNGLVMGLIQREGKALTEKDWIYFAGFDMYTEFLENQILYRYQMESPFLYNQDEDKYRVQIEWGDMDFVYDVGFVDEAKGTGVGWIGNDNVSNHVRISNYSQFPVYISQSLTIDDAMIDGNVYKEMGIVTNSGSYDYSSSALAERQEMLIGSSSNLPTVLDLYVVLKGKPDLKTYKSHQLIGTLTLSVESLEMNDISLAEQDEFSILIKPDEEKIISDSQQLNGEVYQISGGGMAIFDDFEAIDAQEGDLIAQADENSRIIAGSRMDLNQYRFVDRNAQEVSYGEPAAAIYYRKDDADEKHEASENDAIEEQPQ